MTPKTQRYRFRTLLKKFYNFLNNPRNFRCNRTSWNFLLFKMILSLKKKLRYIYSIMFIAALKTRWHRVPDVQIERNLRFVSRSFSFDPHQSWIFISGLYADDITEERAPGSIKSDEHPGRTTSHWIQAPTSRRGSLFFFKMCHSSLVSFVSLSIVYIGRNRTEISKNVSTFPPTIPLTSTVSLLIAVRTMVARKKKRKKIETKVL